jgi:hypothetical protein
MTVLGISNSKGVLVLRMMTKHNTKAKKKQEFLLKATWLLSRLTFSTNRPSKLLPVPISTKTQPICCNFRTINYKISLYKPNPSNHQSKSTKINCKSYPKLSVKILTKTKVPINNRFCKTKFIQHKNLNKHKALEIFNSSDHFVLFAPFISRFLFLVFSCSSSL